MSHEHFEISDLSKRVRRLEQRVKLLSQIADHEKYPFLVQCLELDMDADEIDNMLALINKAEQSLHSGSPMSFAQFEKELLEGIPSQKNKAGLAILILRALHERDKQSHVYDHFKNENKNL